MARTFYELTSSDHGVVRKFYYAYPADSEGGTDPDSVPVQFPDGGYQICAWCNRVMGFAETHLDSHGICEDCTDTLVDEKIESDQQYAIEHTAFHEPGPEPESANAIRDSFSDTINEHVPGKWNPTDRLNIAKAMKIAEEGEFTEESIQDGKAFLEQRYT